MRGDTQGELYLEPRPSDEILEERLAVAVAEFNEPLCAPEARIELHATIVRLRIALGKRAPR